MLSFSIAVTDKVDIGLDQQLSMPDVSLIVPVMIHSNTIRIGVSACSALPAFLAGLVCVALLREPDQIPAYGPSCLLRGEGGTRLPHLGGTEPSVRWRGLQQRLARSADLHRIAHE